MLGERDHLSAEAAAAQMLGYRNELMRQQRGRGQVSGAGPRVREPEGGLGKDKVSHSAFLQGKQFCATRYLTCYLMRFSVEGPGNVPKTAGRGGRNYE